MTTTVRDRLWFLLGFALFTAGLFAGVALLNPPDWPPSRPADPRSAHTVPVLPPDLDGRCTTC